jgi:phosphoribosylformylglycinamidine synthase
MRARASGTGNVVMIIGAETGRDGLHGATFASVEGPESSHRGVVQVGNPFLEKLLLEACLELLRGSDVVAMQDLGAAGLTSSAIECAARGEVGVDIDVTLVPRREPGLTPFEVMLSESQERMLLVVKPDGVDRVSDVVERWSLKSAEIGRVTDTGNVVIREDETIVCDVPARLFTESCPTYTRDAAEDPAIAAARARSLDALPDIQEGTVGQVALHLLGSPNIGSRRPVYQRYDSTIGTNTVAGPGSSDAAVLRIKGQQRGLAISLDCNSRYCYLDPYHGAQLAVAEALRNVSCAGGRPLAITNCLNFRNPEKPAGYFQLSRVVAGMADACRELGVVVVSGNVSLYNETADSAVQPTPTVGCVGVLDDVSRHATMIWEEGDQILLLGGGEPTLGGSEYLAFIKGETTGRPPALELDEELRVQNLVRDLVAEGHIRTAHDVSLGGLAVALAEMAIQSGIGFTLDLDVSERRDIFWFGERSASILIAAPADQLAVLQLRAEASGVPATILGTVTSDALNFARHDSLDLSTARKRYESALVLTDS